MNDSLFLEKIAGGETVFLPCTRSHLTSLHRIANQQKWEVTLSKTQSVLGSEVSQSYTGIFPPWKGIVKL